MSDDVQGDSFPEGTGEQDAAAVAADLAAHEAATGAAVHGLGTAATHAEGDFDAVGAAAAVASAAVLKALYDANTILAATSDNDPAALAVGASTFLGRKATGGIAAMSVSEAQALLTGFILKTVLDANTILYATADDTPAALAVAASRIVGRKASGDIAALTGAEVGQIAGQQEVVELMASDLATAGLGGTGDGKAFFVVPAKWDGWKLVAAAAALHTAGAGATTVQVRRNRGGSDQDMLTTKVTIDASEADSSTGTAGVPDTSSGHDTLATADRVFVDIDAATSAGKGLLVALTLQAP